MAASLAEEEALSVEQLLQQGGGGGSHGCYLQELPPRFVLPLAFRPDLSSSTLHIPIIDLSQLAGPSRAHTLLQIHSACRDWGFFQITHHGIPLQLLDSLLSATTQYLSLPTAQKRGPGIVRGDDGQGFGTGFFNPQVGAAEWRDYLVLHTFPEPLRNYSKWPPMLKDHIAAFSDAILNLSRRLLAVFSENLQLPPNFVEDAMGTLHQKILISHYPPCPQPELAVGACEHTDVGVITCVWQASEDVAGLQVRKDGKWHSVEPLHGAIVVNVADQIEILSNGLYKSGPHRVVLNSSKSRISVVAFHNPPANTEVSPAASLIDSNHPALYEPTLFKTYAAKYGIHAE